MLRRILLAGLLTFSSLLLSAAHAADEDHIMPASDTRPVPWPWTLAQPFPWWDIQGVWKVEQGDYLSYFSLKVVQQKSGVKQLLVKQIDGESCKVIATGVGTENNQRVLAQMTSKSGVTYRVKLTAFKRADSPQAPLSSTVYTDSVMVLSIGNLDSSTKSAEMVHLQISKLSDRIDQKACEVDPKN